MGHSRNSDRCNALPTGKAGMECWPALVVILLRLLAPAMSSDESLHIAICAIVRDQNDDLEEWIQYHNSIGIHRFYIYDNGSVPPASNVLQKQMSEGVVIYATINGTSPQFFAYNKCLVKYSSSHDFIGFIDVDEFVVVAHRGIKIGRVLDHYSDFGGLSLNWKIFGSSGHGVRPAGGVLQNYCTCEPGFDRHTKIFVNTARITSLEVQDPLCSYGDQHGKVLFTSDPHHVCYARKDLYSVSVTFKHVKGPFHHLNVTAPLIYINHYVTKSRADYQRKLDRGRASLPMRHGNKYHSDRSWEEFELIQERCTSTRCGCSTITKIDRRQ